MGLIALPQAAVAPPRRLLTPRLIATLALFVVSATTFCTIVGYVLVRQADDRQALDRRGALARCGAGNPRLGGRFHQARSQTDPRPGAHRRPQGSALRDRACGWPPRDAAGAGRPGPHRRLVQLGGRSLDGSGIGPAPAAARHHRPLPDRLLRSGALAGPPRRTRSWPQREAGLEPRPRGFADRPAQPSQDDRADRGSTGGARARGNRDARLHRSRRPEGHQRCAGPEHRRPVPDRLGKTSARSVAGRCGGRTI